MASILKAPPFWVWLLFMFAVVVGLGSFKVGGMHQKRVTETQMSEARDRSMRTNYCTQICLVQEQPMLGVTEKPEWRCFCSDGYWQPLP